MHGAPQSDSVGGVAAMPGALMSAGCFAAFARCLGTARRCCRIATHRVNAVSGRVMTRSRLSCFGLLLLLASFLASPGSAAETQQSPPAQKQATGAKTAVQHLGGMRSWNAYLYKERSGRVCYLAGSPQKSEPAKSRRKAPVAMVTHRPEENVANVVSFVEGYPLKAGADASLDIDGTHFDLFTKADTAWSRTSDLDKTITEAMAKGRQAVLKATPQKGPPMTDTYSLAGFTQALALIDKACGIKR
jgi:hypothetical protein